MLNLLPLHKVINSQEWIKHSSSLSGSALGCKQWAPPGGSLGGGCHAACVCHITAGNHQEESIVKVVWARVTFPCPLDFWLTLLTALSRAG